MIWSSQQRHNTFKNARQRNQCNQWLSGLESSRSPWRQGKGTVNGVWNNGENSYRSRVRIMQCDSRKFWSLFRTTNHKKVMPANRRPCRLNETWPPIGWHHPFMRVSYPIDSPTATGLGLCSSQYPDLLPWRGTSRNVKAQFPKVNNHVVKV